jgi:tetratricopeptide (TPR) repeat protein
MKVSSRINLYNFLFIFALGCFASLFAVEQVYNYDIWWHLKSGEWTLKHFSVPYSDTFSFSTDGSKWMNSSWLSGVLFALLHQLGGFDLLILFKAVVIGLAFAAAGLLLIRRGVNPYVALLLLGWAIVVARFRFLLRPELFMFPALVILFWLLSESASRNQRLAFVGVPLVVLWVNLHGTAYIAPVFGLFLLLEVIVQKIIQSDKIEATQASFSFTLALFLSLCVAVLLSPYGVEMFQLVIERTVVDDLITNSLTVEEHLPLKWGTRNGYWALLVATGVSFLPIFNRTRLFYLFTYVGTAVLAVTSVRYIGLAAIIQAMILGLNLNPIFEKRVSVDILNSRIFKLTAPAVLVILACFAFQSTFTVNKVYQWGWGINASRYPASEVDYLKGIDFKGNLYNSWETGGYILWHLPPVRTLIDGRVLSAQLVLKDKLDKMSLSTFSAYLTENDVKGALLYKKDALNVQRFDALPQYNLKSFSDKFLVYIRNDFVFPIGIDQVVKFKFIKPQNYDYTYLVPLAKSSKSNDVEMEFKRAVVISPENFMLLFQYGFFMEALNRQEALDLYFQAAKVNPALGFSHFKLGLRAGAFALKYKKWDQAVAIIEQALSYGAGEARHYFLLGTAFYQKKNYTAAEEAYLKALELTPDHVTTLQNIGFLYLDMGRFDVAETYFKKALNLDSGSESAQYGYALALEKQLRPEAKQAWEQFLRFFPNSRWAGNARRYLQ